MNQIEYYECECCGLSVKDTEFYLNPLNKEQDICVECHEAVLEIMKEDNKNQCGCRAGCNYCLMLEY